MARANEGQRGTGRVTLTEVARLAGVSRSAASFALNGRTDLRISEETSERVRRAAEELGYSPNATAKTLRTGKSGTVALVSDFIGTTSVANAMVRGALQTLRDADTLLYTVDTEGDPELESRFLQNLRSRDIDGFLYASMFTRTVSVPALVRGAPFVLLNCVSEGTDATAVVPDEFAAGETAATALLSAGHRDDIWFVGAFPSGFTGGVEWHGWRPLALTERLEGIEATLATAGTSLAGSVPIENDWDIPNGRDSVARLLSSGATPSALICVNDAVAVGAYHALQQAGLRVPDDVSVIAFDGSPLTAAVVPTLTSVALPHEELGRLAAQLLLNDVPTPALHRVPMSLSGGASVAAPAPKR
ncbi:LacI family DNA-binding transcriptional regulator [Microbacterium sp. 13-71-7]|jgi:LacI family transcriptional regulator|uniref:LacI family DNA-binding transcriptional regulator n=1 Tax=Microbacterium sp. 13-71-7 TaxID=1970399 RepID=UPI000BC55B40|nr:LacI family DNA-binding transcriptional regulator [Microbacterium sp. 13-71-7]OZB83592.1 MAG: LacI family transcriptional regulator [Microbacterium sp. 13-71-7]